MSEGYAEAAALVQESAPDFVLEHAETEEHTTPAGTAQPLPGDALRWTGGRRDGRPARPHA